jgi:hypothetical protein
MQHFADQYINLPPGEQTLFAEAVRRLLADGLLWREIDGDRRLYSWLARRSDLVAEYLAVAGWELRHDERATVFQVVHRDGAHRRRLNRDTSIWLLLLRLLYAEQRESMTVSLTRFPTTTVGTLANRYAAFFPGQNVRKKGSLDEALRTLATLKLVRAGGGGTLRANNPDQVIELLPTLEVVVPSGPITELAERISAYNRAAGDEDDDP